MSVQELPVRSDFKAYSFQVNLDGQVYEIKIRFNTRVGRWYINIKDTSGNEILSGIKLLTNIPLIGQYQSLANLPPGEFMCIDETGYNKDAGINDLGNDVKLVYIEAN